MYIEQYYCQAIYIIVSLFHCVLCANDDGWRRSSLRMLLACEVLLGAGNAWRQWCLVDGEVGWRLLGWAWFIGSDGRGWEKLLALYISAQSLAPSTWQARAPPASILLHVALACLARVSLWPFSFTLSLCIHSSQIQILLFKRDLLLIKRDLMWRSYHMRNTWNTYHLYMEIHIWSHVFTCYLWCVHHI